MQAHFPGWLLAGFSQWGHWVGNWRRAGEDGGGGAGSRQGSSPRNLCGGLHGLDSRFPGFTERSQSLGPSTPPLEVVSHCCQSLGCLHISFGISAASGCLAFNPVLNIQHCLLPSLDPGGYRPYWNWALFQGESSGETQV